MKRHENIKQTKLTITKPRDICRNIRPEDILSYIWESPGRQDALVMAWATLVENSTSVVSKTVWAVVTRSPATAIFGAHISAVDEEPGRSACSVVTLALFDRRTSSSTCSVFTSSTICGSRLCSNIGAELNSPPLFCCSGETVS